MEVKPKLLLVEDDDIFRKFLVEELRRDYDILEASTRTESLSKLSLNPDVALLDINFPEAKGRISKPTGARINEENPPTGLRVIVEIHERNPQLEVVMMSGTWDDERTAEFARQRGAYAYFTKDQIRDDFEGFLTTLKSAVETDGVSRFEWHPDATQRVLKALEDSRWDFRTIPGISEETGLSDAVVRMILEKHPEQVRKSEVPSLKGNELFTLRSKPIKFRERIAVARMYLVGWAD
jgi:CheY-like chemotaxis protein